MKNKLGDNIDQVFFTAILFAAGILVVECFFLDIYHEEPTRLLVAQSMLENGNWLVPHILGEPYLKKPPGYNWAVALLSWGYGEVTAASGRLVAVLSWLGLGGLVWWITAGFQNRFHRMLAVVSFLFSATVLVEKAALAEIDLFFAFVLTAAVYAWYRGIEQQRTFTAAAGAHALLALALLTKGPVAYLFFYVPILFLTIGSNRSIPWGPLAAGFIISHTLAAVWVWQVLQAVGFSTYYETVFGETLGRSSAGGIGSYLEQLLTMPIETFFAFLPGTLLLAYLAVYENVSETLGTFWKWDPARLALGGVAPFLFFWLFPVDSTRYLLPIAPWGAALVGMWLEKASSDSVTQMSLATVTKICGGILVLTLPIPWIFEPERAVIGYNLILLASVVIFLIGACIYFSDLFPGDAVKNHFAGMVTFCLVVKMAYLFFYVPVEKPTRVLTQFKMNQYADRIKQKTESNTIIHHSDHGLEIPFYLKKQGLNVIKVTNRSPDRNTPVISENMDSLSANRALLLTMPLPDELKFYVYAPETSGSKTPSGDHRSD